LTLFNPLNDHKKKPTGPVIARKKQGPHGPSSLSPHEVRRGVIERFISRWKRDVGNDIYPAFRLIVPDKDRERAMYGLKEKTIGKLLVRIMKIDKNSEDGFNLLNWKLPGQKVATSMAGDFAGRCYEVISKRPMRTTVGDMTIDEVNDMLDRLSLAQKEDAQLPIMEEFYRRMNAEEIMWLVRMILRQMKVGATEKTIFDIWHPDAETLFNVSSNLRRVCWELYDSSVRLEGDETDINLMQCFQPQLAQFQMHSFDKMVLKMRPTENDKVFWIEEKLDGERMQLHMVEDPNTPGGMRFGFWSRKAKDYTYLYGNGFEDQNSALTRHLKNAFLEGVRNIILDGEMITWDPERDKIVPFGTLKTAALSEQKNPFGSGERPVYRVFDILYLNDEPLKKYTLRDRRKALEASVKPVHRRMEIHTYTEASTAKEIEPLLRQVVAEASEGLVVKNPRSMYRLNERNDDWMKVKPEYMTEYGEDLDCIVIGGYYGSGKRGGALSSFLCGLRVDQNQISQGANPMKCYSFFKVGGGFSASDYATLRHQTDGKWKDWDRHNPPTEFMELGGKDGQSERPDVWIRPDESVVLSVKGASVGFSDDFRCGLTLRFPRFKHLRTDRDWSNALSIQGFIDLKNNIEKEQKEKKFTVDDARKKRARVSRKKEIVIAGAPDEKDRKLFEAPNPDFATKDVFKGLDFYIMTESLGPTKKSKVELEAYVKTHGGAYFQSATARENVICIGDRNLVPVSILQKKATKSIIRPCWLFDCIKQAERDVTELGRTTPLILLYEPRHCLYVRKEDQNMIGSAVDEWGDSVARDVFSIEEMRELLNGMPNKFEDPFENKDFLTELEEHGHWTGQLVGSMFKGLVVYFDTGCNGQEATGMDLDDDDDDVKKKEVQLCESLIEFDLAANIVGCAEGLVTHNLAQTNTTHVVVDAGNALRLREIRQLLKRYVYSHCECLLRSSPSGGSALTRTL